MLMVMMLVLIMMMTMRFMITMLQPVSVIQDWREQQLPRHQTLLSPSSTFSEEHFLFMDTGQHYCHHHRHHHHHHAFLVIRFYVRVSFLIQYFLYKNIACFTGQVPPPSYNEDNFIQQNSILPNSQVFYMFYSNFSAQVSFHFALTLNTTKSCALL